MPLHDNLQPTRKAALVTGASRGVGAAIAVEFARRGIAPVLAVRVPQTAEAVAARVRALGVPCHVVACDVSDFESVQRALTGTLQAFGRLDIVINNAAQVDPIARIASSDPAEWAHAFQVNVIGAYHVTRAALPALLATGCGTIVNLSSGAAHTPREGWSAYCSTKAALAMLTRSIDLEYAAEGIAAYGFHPGMVDTDMQARIRRSGLNAASRVPRVQLAPAEPSAAAIAWLADLRPQELAGRDLSIGDAELARQMALQR